MGFQFIGDFLDRHWTCHILEYEPKDDPIREKLFAKDKPNILPVETLESLKILERLETRFEELIKPKNPHLSIEPDKRQWRQRKVLELLIFDRMLQKITRRYEEMLKVIEGHLRDEANRLLGPQHEAKKPSGSSRSDVLSAANALFSAPMDNDAYSSFSKQWPPFQYTLQVMEEDLKKTLETIGLWRTREKDRQLERPRWTRNDEGKYRPVMTKITTSNNHRVRELERYLANIESLKTSLMSRLESTRNELSFQSAENVRFFTYVTVIFLPLGFATAIFSTSGAPGTTPLIGMVVTAIITLLLTVLALANAQFLDKTLFRPAIEATCQVSNIYRLPSQQWKNRKVGWDQPKIYIPIHHPWKSFVGKYRGLWKRERRIEDGSTDDPRLEEGKKNSSA